MKKFKSLIFVVNSQNMLFVVANATPVTPLALFLCMTEQLCPCPLQVVLKPHFANKIHLIFIKIFCFLKPHFANKINLIFINII